MPLTQDQINAQVQAAGYNGPMDPVSVNAAYARAATPSDLASSGIQFTNPATNTQQANTTANPYDPSMAGLQAFAAQTSGVTAAQLAQQKQEFDAQLQFAQQQMQQLGIPQLQINQQLAQLQQQQFQQQIAQLYGYQTPGGGAPAAGTPTLAAQAQAASIAQSQAGLTGYYQNPAAQSWNTLSTQLQQAAGQNYNDAAAKQAFAKLTGQSGTFNGSQAVNLTPDQLQQIATAGGAPGYGAGTGQQTLAGQLQQAGLTGQYQGAPTEAASEFSRNLALQQGQLGQQYLATASQLTGPQNTFQLSNYMRGAQGNQAVPTYLQNLASNTNTPTFQGAGSTAPTPQSAAGLTGQMAGQQSATPGWDYNQTYNTMRQIQNQGAQALRPGALEGMTPDELQAFGSGLGAVGGSLPSFLQQYQQSRVGQSALPQTQLA